MTLPQAVKTFMERYGKPRLVVVSRFYHFPVKELGLEETNCVSIPEDLWPRHRLLIEHAITRMVVEINGTED